MTEKRVCRDFMKNPKEDPLDGHRLVPGRGPYMGYVELCIANKFNAEYMLDEDFIKGLSSKPKRSTSPTRSPRTISIPRSPKSSSLRSQPMLPRSVPSVIKPDNLPTRSFSDKRLNIITPQTTQTVYPRVVAPSVQSVPIQQRSVVQRGPVPSYTTRSEQIGTERFDPDPVTTATKIPERSVRKTVQGPYGPNGENTVVSGVHKLPGQIVYSTYDIPEHEVRSVNSGYNISNNQRSRVLLPPPKYTVRSEQIGIETFDPDPITTVTDIPSKSVRTTVNGPYGQSGENIATTGVYTSPTRRVYTTSDIPEHQVRSINNSSAMPAQRSRVLLPQPSFTTKSEQIGTERFDPDPITTVTNIPPKSVRTTVNGPYGQSGENISTNGVYTSPGRRIYSTRDIPEHEVRSIQRSAINDEF